MSTTLYMAPQGPRIPLELAEDAARALGWEPGDTAAPPADYLLDLAVDLGLQMQQEDGVLIPWAWEGYMDDGELYGFLEKTAPYSLDYHNDCYIDENGPEFWRWQVRTGVIAQVDGRVTYEPEPPTACDAEHRITQGQSGDYTWHPGPDERSFWLEVGSLVLYVLTLPGGGLSVEVLPIADVEAGPLAYCSYRGPGA